MRECKGLTCVSIESQRERENEEVIFERKWLQFYKTEEDKNSQIQDL